MRLILANQSVAAKRRCYFDVRDATDGITPETAEAAGQPQISSNGAAWTNTGIGTLTHIGNGRYYADLTQAAVATAGDIIETRYKSAATAETPGDSFQVVAFDPDSVASLGLSNLDAAVSTRLAPTVAARTLDVSVGGEAGVDWANVGTPGSTVNLSATTVNLTNTLTTYTGNTVQTGDSFARLGAPAGASVSADILVLDNFVDDLESRIGVPSNLGSGATVAANLVDIEAQTDDIGAAGAGLTAITGATLSSAYDFAKGTVAPTESYRAAGGVPTPIQALLEILANVCEFAISGTTKTAKKVDGAATAKTYTLNSATAPTSITEAT